MRLIISINGNFLVVSIPHFTTNFTTTSPQQLAQSCPILPRCQPKYTFHNNPEIPCKQGLSGAIQGETKL